jgi:hypothetical protein
LQIAVAAIIHARANRPSRAGTDDAEHPRRELDMREGLRVGTMGRREPLIPRCAFHPQRRARFQWYEKQLCEECWERLHTPRSSHS